MTRCYLCSAMDIDGRSNAVGEYINASGANVHLKNTTYMSARWRLHKVKGAADTYTIENVSAVRKYLETYQNGAIIKLGGNPTFTSTQWRIRQAHAI